MGEIQDAIDRLEAHIEAERAEIEKHRIPNEDPRHADKPGYLPDAWAGREAALVAVQGELDGLLAAPQAPPIAQVKAAKLAEFEARQLEAQAVAELKAEGKIPPTVEEALADIATTELQEAKSIGGRDK